MSDSEAPRSDKQCLAVPDSDGNGAPPNGNGNGDGAPSSSKLAHRRCSARLLSLNVREAIRVLRQKEHKARVSALVQRNADFYRKQRCCECAAMMSVLAIFTSFALYVIFAYGFHIGKRLPFTLVQSNYTSKIKKMEVSVFVTMKRVRKGQKVTKHSPNFRVTLENYGAKLISIGNGVVGSITTNIAISNGNRIPMGLLLLHAISRLEKSSFWGIMTNFSAGSEFTISTPRIAGFGFVKLKNIIPDSLGGKDDIALPWSWAMILDIRCGFHRIRYGELRTAPFTVVVVEPAQSSPTSDLLGEDPFYPRVDGNQSQGMDDNLIWYASFMNLSHPTPTGNNPNRSGDGEFHDDGRNQSGNTTLSSLIIENREEYQRKFFLLKVRIKMTTKKMDQ